SEQENQHSRDTQGQLTFVWDLENNNDLVKKAAILIIDNNYYLGIGRHPLTIFFNNLNEVQKVKAKPFLLSFITDYNADDKRMNPVFDVIRHSLNEFFEEAF